MKKNKFSQNLKNLRTKYNLSQDSLAKKVNVSKQTISKYEKGTIEPNFHTLIEISKLFNCSLDSLVFGDSKLENKNPLELSLLLEKQFDILLDKEFNFLKKELSLLKDETHSLIDKYFNSDISSGKTEFAKELTPDINLLNLNSKVYCINKLENKRNSQKICIDRNKLGSAIPILGSVSAGNPCLAVENLEGHISIPPEYISSKKDYFMLKVKGDSMNKIYYPNELLLVEKSNSANNGDMVIALIDIDECTLKEYEKVDDTIYLYPHSTNPEHKVQEYNIKTRPCHIIGIVKNIVEFN